MVETKTTLNFIITNTKKEDLVISTKTHDWKITLAPHTRHHQLLKHYIATNTLEEINVVLDILYVTSTTMLSDMALTNHILKYFKDLEAAPYEEVSAEEDAEILKQVKDDTAQTDNNG